MIAASRQTLIANIIQQACAAAVILLLPNIMSKPDYAQVVYVGVLLSFAAFADVGISLVYGRVVPALHTMKNHAALSVWNSTSLKFGLLTSSVYAVIIAALFYARYETTLHAMLLLPVPFIVFWFSFHVGRMSATGDFHDYRKSITWRALGSLMVLPLALVIGLTGWFVGTLGAAMLALARLGKRLWQPIGGIDWGIIRRHLKEALLLSSISVLWLQLLNFARLYASMHYNAEDIATYGILSAGYQSVSALVISIFLPVSVGLLGRYGESEASAMTFAHTILRRSLPWVLALTCLGIVAAPYVLAWGFPSYQFSTDTITPMLLGLPLHPFFIIWGNLLVARQHAWRYLLIILLGLAASAATAGAIDHTYPIHGAAWGQLGGLTLYTIILYAAARATLSNAFATLWNKQLLYLVGVGIVGLLVVAAHYS